MRDRDPVATAVRLLWNVMLFLGFLATVAVFHVWLERLVQNQHLHHESGGEVAFKTWFGLTFSSVPALAPHLILTEVAGRTSRRARLIAVLGAVGGGILLGAAWMSLDVGVPPTLAVLGFTSFLVYALTAVLPNRTRDDSAEPLAFRLGTALAVAVLGTGAYSLLAYANPRP